MDEITALVAKNEYGVSDEVKEQLLRQLKVGSFAQLSPEKEAGPFMLYCCGDDIETVATKTNYPPAVILLTAIYYKWPEKAKALRRDADTLTSEAIQKDLANSLLVATYMAVQEDLKDVIAGRKSAAQARFLPRSVQALERLMSMVTDLNKPPEGAGAPPMQINADNVQINQITEPEKKEVSEDKKKELDVKYTILRKKK